MSSSSDTAKGQDTPGGDSSEGWGAMAGGGWSHAAGQRAPSARTKTYKYTSIHGTCIDKEQRVTVNAKT